MAFSVNSKIKLNFRKIKALNANQGKALEMTTDALLTEVKNAEAMPFDTGNLQNESTFPDYSDSHTGVTRIVSSTPYARRLYYHPEYNFHREVWYDKDNKQHGANKNAGGEWFIPWQKDGTRQNFCVKTFAKIYKELSGT